MFALVADIPSYPQFLPWCRSARVLSADEDVVVAEIEIAYGGVHKSFTTRNLLQKDKMMELRLERGPFSHLHGYWRFEALDAQSCKVTLDLEFAVANRMMDLVLTPVFANIAGQLVDSFHKRAKSMYGVS
jgi:coenzyme Q-binding protein COQ10